MHSFIVLHQLNHGHSRITLITSELYYSTIERKEVAKDDDVHIGHPAVRLYESHSVSNRVVLDLMVSVGTEVRIPLSSVNHWESQREDCDGPTATAHHY